MGVESGGIGSLEELVLLAIQNLCDDAYGTTIYEALEEAGRSISIGSLYVTLGRLEDKGYVRSQVGEPTAERGGRAKKYYRITGAGSRLLAEAAESRAVLRKLRFDSGGLI